MSRHLLREALAEKAIIREQAFEQPPVDRSFEMPTALYGVFAASLFAFLAITAVGFASPGLIIPMAIFVVFITGFFVVPAIWTRIGPDDGKAPLTLGQLRRRGIATYTGRLDGRDATVQMLILPVMLVVWGLAVVTIAAFN
ncbi:hypothetical protein [Qipengyuania sp. JC766]|uniref:hypothetical protein n=1 Tax=Qipengyuania sp. JC766 TaxID=3232139 RepID=UPI0034573C46